MILDKIPVLKLTDKDKARRFISLIDALYEARCKIVVMAEAEPEEIFFPDAAPSIKVDDMDIMMAESVGETRDAYRPNVSSYDAPSMEEAPVERVMPLDTLSIFSGRNFYPGFFITLMSVTQARTNSLLSNEHFLA